jgi:hypothetical protein
VKFSVLCPTNLLVTYVHIIINFVYLFVCFPGVTTHRVVFSTAR